MYNNMYICDSANCRVQKFDNNGNFITKWSIQSSDPSWIGTAYDIVVTTAGSVYVVDSYDNNVQVFWPKNGFGP